MSVRSTGVPYMLNGISSQRKIFNAKHYLACLEALSPPDLQSCKYSTACSECCNSLRMLCGRSTIYYLMRNMHSTLLAYLLNRLPPVQESVIMVRDLFRNKDMTEFIIATIPTMLGINESSRLLKVLRKGRHPLPAHDCQPGELPDKQCSPWQFMKSRLTA